MTHLKYNNHFYFCCKSDELFPIQSILDADMVEEILCPIWDDSIQNFLSIRSIQKIKY